MNDIIITVGSVTFAIKTRRLLLRHGIQSRLVKTDTRFTENGCTHGVKLNKEDYLSAVVILKENGISHSVYKPNAK